MKKIILLATILTTSFSFGQNIFPADGNVGIGTTNPTSKLDVKGAVFIQSANSNYNENLRLFPSTAGDYSSIVLGAVAGSSGTGIGQWTFVRYPSAYNYLFSIRYNSTDYLNITNGGNIGIGTTTPTALLDINTKLPVQGVHNTQHWTTDNSGYSLKLQTVWTNNGINQQFVQKFNGVDYNSLSFFAGNVGIGTSTPDEKFTVKGKIHAQEVKVDMLGALVPDYVFANDYKLKTLEEVETYINKNSHLPEIPSAKEIEKNGLMLAEMNMNLLKKIEELTLYMIEMNKKMEVQQKENMAQSKEIEILKEQNRFPQKI